MGHTTRRLYPERAMLTVRADGSGIIHAVRITREGPRPEALTACGRAGIHFTLTPSSDEETATCRSCRRAI